MGWTKGRLRIVMWYGILCCIITGFYNMTGNVVNADKTLPEEVKEEYLKNSLDFFYPVIAKFQTADVEEPGKEFVSKVMFRSLPVAEYIVAEGEKTLYATEMENELSQDVKNILEKEAADENHIDENGDIVTADGSANLQETLIAEQVLEEFAEYRDAKEAASSNVSGENIEKKNKPQEIYDTSKLSYDFLIDHFYTVDSTTSISKKQLDAKKLLAMDMTMKQDNKKPQILIYHSHSQEDFVDSVKGDSSTTIVGVGKRLKELLEEKYGYNVIHNTKSYDLVNGKLDRNEAYTLALKDVEKILEKNPSIEVVIDLHRDGIEGKKLVTEINGKPTAQIMFFNGLSYTNKNGAIDYLENPYISENLSFSLQLQLEAAKYYPGATRRIYLKGYRYNLHVRPKSLLVESGAQNNTLEEQLNAMEVLADVLNKVLSPQ